MAEPFVEMLRGATNTLGRTEEVVELVIADRTLAQEVYDLFFQDDEWVRLRAASASKRLWRADEEIIEPFVEGWVAHVSSIDQPSSQWRFAQFCDECDDLLTDDQRAQAIAILTTYLKSANDWIVLNSSMPPLATWAQTRPELEAAILPRLEQLAKDDRKSVANRATKSLAKLA